MSATLQNSPVESEYRLSAPQISYYGRYFGDPLSRLFWYESGLYLGLLPPYGKRFDGLRCSETFRDLVNTGLVPPIKESILYIDGFDSIYRIESTPRITYWHEWGPKMLRTATLQMLDLMTRLARNGLTLRYPHPWNLLFDGRQFTYVNPGSIVPLDPDAFKQAYEKVTRFFVRPLLLMEHGFEHTARRLLADVRDGVLAEDVRNLQGDWAELPAAWAEQSALEIVPFLAKVSEGIEFLAMQTTAKRWIDYFAKDCDFGPGTSWTRKQELLTSILEEPDIHSVLDLGANTGHYARFAAGCGKEVIAADFDPALVDVIYEGIAESNVPLYPVVLDFAHPTPGEGVDYLWFPSATERMDADLVLCFALEHHMVFGKYRLNFDQIALGVRTFSRTWALVEYIERGKNDPKRMRPDADEWYTIDHFAAAFRQYFDCVEVLPPAKDNRQLLVCGPRRHQS